MLNLLILSFGSAAIPSRKFRVHAFEPLFREAGISYAVRGLSDGLVPRWASLLSLPRAKVLILQKKLIRPAEFNRLRARAGKIIYDFDDAVYLSPKVRDRFEYIVRHSDVVFAGNRVLAVSAQAYNPNTVIVPTGLDLIITARFKRRKRSVRSWAGSARATT